MKMRIISGILALCAGFAVVSCEKKAGGETPDGGGTPTVERVNVLFQDLAEKIGSGYDAFSSDYGKYAVEGDDGSFYAYVKTQTDSIPCLIEVMAEEAGMISEIEVTLDGSYDEKGIWEKLLTGAESFGFGQYLGTKFKSPSLSGVQQTVDDAIAFVTENGTQDVYSYSMFGIIPLTCYAVVGLENGAVSVSIINSYYKIDYARLRALLGTDYNTFAEANYILGFKMSLWGDNYFYFDYAKDISGNAFYVDVHADQEVSSILQVDCYVSPDYNDADAQLEIWKDYVAEYESYGLGTFVEAYSTDGFGDKVATFEDPGKVVEHVEQNGRPGAFDGGLIIIFDSDGVRSSLVMNKDSVYVMINRPEAEA